MNAGDIVRVKRGRPRAGQEFQVDRVLVGEGGEVLVYGHPDGPVSVSDVVRVRHSAGSGGTGTTPKAPRVLPSMTKDLEPSPARTIADGPWRDEPDLMEFEHVGSVCLLVRDEQDGAWRGYVGLPDDHPWRIRGHDDPRWRHPRWNSVHGGITYIGSAPTEASAARSVDLWVGFDCAHHNGLGDLVPDSAELGGTYRDVAFAEREVKRLAEAAAHAAAASAVEDAVHGHVAARWLAQIEQAILAWRESAAPIEVDAVATMSEIDQMVRDSYRVKLVTNQLPVERWVRDAVDLCLIGEQTFIEIVGVPSREVEPTGTLQSVPLPSKRRVIQGMMTREPAVLIHLDPRRPGVDVPDHLSRSGSLVLRFGKNLTPPIPDLEVDDRQISGTLAFDGAGYRCRVPWSAVYAAIAEHGQRGIVWAEDAPAEIRKLWEAAADHGESPAASPGHRRPHLKLVD